MQTITQRDTVPGRWLRCGIHRLQFLLAFTVLMAFFPSHLAAQAPPDGRMDIALSAQNTFTLSVQTGSLWEYRIEASDDLAAGIWTPLDSVFLPGDGARHSQRVVVPQGAPQSFFRYRVQPRAGGLSGDALADWDRIYTFNASTVLDSDGDGVPDYLETALNTNRNDALSMPWQVVRVEPFDNQAGHPRDGAVVVYLNQPLPVSVASVPSAFVRQLFHTQEDYLASASVASGSVIILPGRKAVALLPSPIFAAGSNHTAVNNYKIDFTAATTGIPKLAPWHSEFSTVDTLDVVGSWVKLVRPGETAIEVATDFAPVIEWSQPLHPNTLVSTNVSVVNQATGVPVAVGVAFDYDTNRMTLTHAAPFDADTAYTITLGTGFANLMGRPLLNAFTWSFRTRPAPVLPVAGQGPFVAAASPGNYATQVDPASAGGMSVAFSEAMDATTLTAATVHLRAHGSSADLEGDFYYDAPTKTLLFILATALDPATRYELTLDKTAILSAATPPQPMQAQALFVFTTASVLAGIPTVGGGMGGPGSGPAGSSGTPEPDQLPPFQLQVAYGDPDLDAGASVQMTVTLAGGSQRKMQLPNATNTYRTEITPEFPANAAVEIAPQFLKGNDSDYEEELSEVQAEVSVPPNAANPAASNIAVFKGAGASPWTFLGQLIAGPFVAQVSNANGDTEKLKFSLFQLTIFNGLAAQKATPYKWQNTTGAFTVANLNDTDGNGVADNVQNGGVPLEVDLMKLVLYAPPGSPGTLKLTAASGSIKFWADSNKTTAIQMDQNDPKSAFFPITEGPGGFSKIVWVEATAPSTAVRDIEIVLGYKPANAAEVNGLDHVHATGVWAQLAPNGMKTNGVGYPAGWINKAPNVDSEFDQFKTTFTDLLSGQFGIFDAQPNHNWISHSIGFQFQVLPQGISAEPVTFDITRQRESMAWEFGDGAWTRIENDTALPASEIPNDDNNTKDEYNAPQNDFIYSIDNVKIPVSVLKPSSIRFIQRANFREFVSIRFDGRVFQNNNSSAEGSRCSSHVLWQVRDDISKSGQDWVHTPGGTPKLDSGSTPLGTHP